MHVALGGDTFDAGGLNHIIQTAAAVVTAQGDSAFVEPIMCERTQAARSIKPGCKQYELKKWNPSSSKPQVAHLRAEVARRDRNAACNNWLAGKCAQWLYTHGPPEERIEPATPMATSPAVDAPPSNDGDDNCTPHDDEEECVDPSKMRWAARRHVPRLVETIRQNRDAFLRRDQSPKTREELDGAARNSFWQTAAQTFADPNFNPPLLVSTNETTNEKWAAAKLNPGPTKYPATAEKLETEFKSLRTLLVAALNKFRASGMGNCADPEKTGYEALEKGVSVEESNTVYSSEFKDFVRVPTVLYAYEASLPSAATISASGHSCSLLHAHV